MSNDTQTILITGSSSGLGLQMTRSFVAKGHTVIATMRNINGKNADIANELNTYATSQSGELHTVNMDVTDDQSVQTAIENILKQVGTIDVVINNAGVGGGGFTEAFTPEQFQLTFDVNVLGVQRVMRAILPTMRHNQSGLIINISSAMGRMVIPFAGAYTASKYALEGLSETYRYELHETGIDVVIVEPGGFATNYWSSMMQAQDTKRVNSYGDGANRPDEFWQGVSGMIGGAEAADPQNLVDAVYDLIALPSEKRPLRLVVDPVTGGDAPKTINATSETVQRSVLSAFGFEHLVSAIPESE